MRFSKYNNPNKRRRTHKLTENDCKLMDEARLLMLTAERNGEHDRAYALSVALNTTINHK